MKHQFALLGTIVMMGFTAGCGEVDAASGEEDVDSAELAQIDWGIGVDWRAYTATFGNDAELGKILVIGNSSIGDFRANTEYWYVNVSNLQYLGSQDVSFAHSDGTGTPPPYSGTQQFRLPAVATWQSFTSDPTGEGYRYGSNGVYLRLFKNSAGLTRVMWYQTIPSNATPANVTPNGSFSPGTGSVSIPSGQSGYYVDQTP